MIDLPELPRQLKKREADVTPRVLEWFRANYSGSCALEIKATSGNSIPASAVLPHQKLALWDVALRGGIVHKLSDEARRKQPFDAFCLKGCPAYVVACFTTYHTCYLIPIQEWKGIKIDPAHPGPISI